MAEDPVIVTGVEDELPRIAQYVRRAGFSPAVLPTIRIERKALTKRGLGALKNIDRYDYLLFTSAHTARIFGEIMGGLRIRRPRHLKIAAIGKATAAAGRRAGFPAAYVRDAAGARAMIACLRGIKGKRVLFPRSAAASDEALRALRARGAAVDAVDLYTSVPVATDRASFCDLLDQNPRAILFLSPSSVAGFAKNLRSAILRKRALAIRAFAIGTTSANAARETGFIRVAIPKSPSIVNLVELLRNHDA